MAQQTPSSSFLPKTNPPPPLTRSDSALSKRAATITQTVFSDIQESGGIPLESGDIISLSKHPPKKKTAHEGDVPPVLTSEPVDMEADTIPKPLYPSFTFPIEKPVPLPSKQQVVEESFDRLFGPDFSKITFKQGTIGDCYLVAVFDALIHHPVGERLLRKVKIESIRDEQDRVDRYRVTFPSNRAQGNVVEFSASEFGPDRYRYKLLHGPAGLRILELAYLKLVRSARNEMREKSFPDDGFGHTPLLTEGGHPHDVLLDMFGGENVYITPRHYAKTDRPILPSDRMAASEQAVAEFKNLLWHMVASKNNYYFLCAKTAEPALPGTTTFQVPLWRGDKMVNQTFETSHTYSIRAYDPDTKMVTLANPHNTAIEVIQLHRDEFCQIFRSVSGIRIPKSSLGTN
jgi:hypothetical protein